MKTNQNEHQSFLATSSKKYFKIGLAGALLFCIGIFELPLYSKTINGYVPTSIIEDGNIISVSYLPPDVIELPKPPIKETPPPVVKPPVVTIVTTSEPIIKVIETPTPLIVEKGDMVKVVEKTPPTPVVNNGYVEVAAIMPTFGKGENDLFNFIKKHIRYEDEMLDFQGKVYVRFIIDKNGKVTEAEVVKGVHPILDKEALRVVKSMPAWIPGKQNGQEVNVRMVLPINFQSI